MGIVDRKRIATNTLLLYIRMGLIMLIGLYTSRVVLSALGEVDFGLYGAVGGIVVAFSFLNGVMSAACNRYFSIEIGRGDYDSLKKVFSLNVTIFLGLGAIILILAETVGLWFLNAKMVYPPERAEAVGWVYQISVVSFILTMLATPYRAMIIAKEKMKVFAYCSVVEAALKLATALLIASAPFDRLVFYASGMASVSVLASLFFALYCIRYYKECRYRFVWDGSQVREIVGYTGWNIIGNLSGIGRSQGINILLNMFFGPVVNAARGVAYTVYSTIYQFVTNFMMAFNPQITKAYSADERRDMMKLVFQASKFSYLLLYLLVLPFLFETPLILDVWLKDVPAGAVAFTRIMLLNLLSTAMNGPLTTVIQATGKVKWYEIVVGGTLLFSVPASYILLKLQLASPKGVLWMVFGLSIISNIESLYFTWKVLQMDVRSYCLNVLSPIFKVSILSLLPPVIITLLLPASLGSSLVNIAACLIFTSIFTVLVGLTRQEKEKVRNAVVKYLGQLKCSRKK